MSTDSSKPGAEDDLSPRLGDGGPAPRLWAWALGAALLAGILASAVGESVHGRFEAEFVPPPGFDKLGPYEQSDLRSRGLRAAMVQAGIQNAILAYGVLGGVLGLTLGVAGGRSRGFWRTGVVPGVLGGVLGTALGASGAVAAGWMFFRLALDDTGITPPLSAHLALLGMIGAGGGLALGLGHGGKGAAIRGLLGGLFGGLAGAFVYEFTAANLDPLMRNEAPVPPDRIARVLLHVVGSAALAILAAVFLGATGRPKRS